MRVGSWTLKKPAWECHEKKKKERKKERKKEKKTTQEFQSALVTTH